RIKSDFVAYACGNLSSFASNSSWQRPPRTSNDWSASSAKRHNPSCPRRLSCSPPKKNSGRPQCSRPRQCLFPALVFQHPRLVTTTEVWHTRVMSARITDRAIATAFLLFGLQAAVGQATPWLTDEQAREVAAAAINSVHPEPC